MIIFQAKYHKIVSKRNIPYHILQEFNTFHLNLFTFFISGWNDFANSIMNKWFSFYYTYYEDRKRSGIASDPIDNEYDSSESISVIPSKHFYYT